MVEEVTPVENVQSPGAFAAAASPPLPDRDNAESILVHPRLAGGRLALLAYVVIVPVAVLGLTTTVAVVAMVYWLAAIGMTGLVAIVLAVLNSSRSLTLTSSR